MRGTYTEYLPSECTGAPCSLCSGGNLILEKGLVNGVDGGAMYMVPALTQTS